MAPPRWPVLAIVVIGIAVAYLFFVSAGKFVDWPSYGARYDQQAEGYRSGHLYISIPPSPQLLAKTNPYDWSNVGLWYWDTSLYKTHYYLYWGPFPAFALAAFKTLFRMQREVGDQYLVYAFYVIYAVAGALLLERLARRLFPRLGLRWTLFALIVFAFASPTPYELASPGIYEAAIIADQAFLLLGLVFAFDAGWGAPNDGRLSRAPLVLAGVSWAIAIACRASVGPTVMVLILATAIMFSGGGKPGWKIRLRNAAFMAAPVAGCAAGLLLYNRLRFDRWFEFGMRYQLNTLPFLTSRSYVFANVYSYLFRPIKASCEFPFVSAMRSVGRRGFPPSYIIPAGYATYEPLAGLLATTLWVWLGALSPLMFRPLQGSDPRSAEPEDRCHRRARIWISAVSVTLFVFPMLPFVELCAATMRYLADISTGAVLLGTATAWTLLDRSRASRQLRWPVCICVIVAGVLTILVGVFLGLQGYDDLLKVYNPSLYSAAARVLSLCKPR